jgi:hypothetical protein
MSYLGNIVDTPSDPNSQDNWALIIGGVVQEVIVADLSFIQSIQSQYDYLVDVTVCPNAQEAAPGNNYIASTDNFVESDANAIAQLGSDLYMVAVYFGSILADAQGMTLGDVNTAISNLNSSDTGGFDSVQLTAWTNLLADIVNNAQN